MFTNSRNVVVNGGTFNAIGSQGGEVTANITRGLDVLRQHIASGALHDSAERSNAATCCLNTRLIVLDEIMRWIADRDKGTSILWIHGPAGSGKTVICQTIAERCQEAGDLAASFFFDRVGLDRNNEKSFIATIAYQLAHSIDEAKPYVAEAVLKDGLIFKKTLATQIRVLVLRPIRAMVVNCPDVLLPKIILIDGIDECQSSEGGPLAILQVLQTAMKESSCPFQIIVASRMEPDIRDVFEGDLHHLTHVLSLDGRYNPEIDIATYFRSNFSTILKKHRRNRSMSSLPHPWPSKQVLETLVAKSSGQFIYAATVINFVDVRHQLPSQRLDLILGLELREGEDTQPFLPFADLDRLYQEIFRTVVDLSFTLRVLGALFMLHDPLPIDSLEELLGLRPGDVDIALCKLHSIVTIPDISHNERHIQISHASLQDFLFDRRRAGMYHIEANKIHSDLSQCCHRLLLEWIETGTHTVSTVGSIVYHVSEGTTAQTGVYVHDNLLHHMLVMTEFDDGVLSQISKIDPSALFQRVLYYDNMNFKARKDKFTAIKRSQMPALDQLSALVARLQRTDHPRAKALAETYAKEFLVLFKETWQPRFEAHPNILPRTLAILAATLNGSPIHVHAVRHLLQIEWKEFGLATLVLIPYMDFHNLVTFTSTTFEEYIKDSSRCGEYYPLTPDIHADMVIYCFEFIKGYQPTSRSLVETFMASDDRHAKFDKLMGEQGAIFYANKWWKEHLRLASARRVLNYAYFAVVRSGFYPICTHQVKCHIRCEVVGLYKCIESNILDLTIDPSSDSEEEDLRLFPLLSEMLRVKYIDTPLFSNIKAELEIWKGKYRKEVLRGTINPCQYVPPDDIIIGDYEEHSIQEILTNSRTSRAG